MKYAEGLGTYIQHYILHEGPKGPAQALLRAAGAWSYELHDEIWVFNNGFWQKNAGLWVEVQKANWDDVILKVSRDLRYRIPWMNSDSCLRTRLRRRCRMMCIPSLTPKVSTRASVYRGRGA